jgi:molybdopterin synthase catalytic subunit
MRIKIYNEVFDPFAEIQGYQEQFAGIAGKYGATSIFIGTMRDFSDGQNVAAMVLEYYPGMTEKQLQKFIVEARKQWQFYDALVVHRVGLIEPDQAIVLVAVWAFHRGDAFDACRYIMEALKSRAPFWKKETLSTNEDRWVAKNTHGYQQTKG